jgi:hypothetical protein
VLVVDRVGQVGIRCINVWSVRVVGN